MQVRKQQLELDNRLVPNRKRSTSRLYIVTLLIELISRIHHVKSQAGIKIAGRNINNIRYANDTPLMAESKEELKCLLMKVRKKSEEAGLKLSLQKMKIMESGPITSWQINGGKMETVTAFIFLGSKITAVTAAMKSKDTYSLEEKL